MISAECYSDDHKIEISFDAEPWFEQAAAEDLLALARCGWGAGYPADAVADFFDDAATSDLFSYLAFAGKHRGLKDEAVGYECHVDRNQAMAWLEARRPDLHGQILALAEAA